MLTETQMREFFQQVVDQVATLSTQANQVDGLQQQVNDLYQRISTLEEDNRGLREELARARTDHASAKEESERHYQAFNNEQAVSTALKETIVQRDSRVNDLEGALRSEIDSHRITKADLEDARRSAQEWEANYNKVKDDCDVNVAAANEWRQRANEAQNKVHELQAKLDRVQSIFNSPELRVVEAAS